MTTESDQHVSSSSCTHRFLSLPAVRPCVDAVSVASLLRAVLAIAQDITHRSSASKDGASQLFPIISCRRAPQRAVHITRLLVAFLEELYNGEQENHLLLVAISEFYVAFQKLRALLHDCALRGARILLLLSAHRVDREFRAFHESVATAIDSLPLPLNVDHEVAELAELAAKQAQRASRAIVAAADQADDRAFHDIMAILSSFERGITPKTAVLRRVLDHLGIRTWADCDAEVVFLESQIDSAASDYTGSSPTFHLDLLQGIHGLMLYARAVLFDAPEVTCTSPTGRDRDGGSPSSRTEFAWLDNKDLRCPISLDLMTDPVIISSGHTYDRASIVRWIGAGNHTCPVTGKHLRGASRDHLVSNLALSNIIHRLCQARRVKIPEQPDAERKRRRALPTANKAAAGALRLVAEDLVRQLSKGSSEVKCGAVREARLLSKCGMRARAALTDAGASPRLLVLLASSDKRIREDAVAAVMNLSKHADGRREIFEAGGVRYLADLLSDNVRTSPDSRANAAGTLFYLASANEEYRVAIGESDGAIQGLVNLLRTGAHRGKKHALTAILEVLASSVNHAPVIAAGAVPAMLGLLASEKDDLVADAVTAVAAIVERPRGAQAVLAEPSRICSLVEVLRSSVPAVCKECCISALTALCKNGGAETVGYLNKIPMLMPSLYSLLTESSPAASKKSRSLIRIIHRVHGDAGEQPRFPPSIAYPSTAIATAVNASR